MTEGIGAPIPFAFASALVFARFRDLPLPDGLLVDAQPRTSPNAQNQLAVRTPEPRFPIVDLRGAREFERDGDKTPVGKGRWCRNFENYRDFEGLARNFDTKKSSNALTEILSETLEEKGSFAAWYHVAEGTQSEMSTALRGAVAKHGHKFEAQMPVSRGRALRPQSVRLAPETAKPVGVVVVDDQPLTRMGLKVMLASQRDMQLLGEAEDSDSALRAVEYFRPDVVLVDATLAGSDHAAILRAVLRSVPGTRIVALGLRDGDEEIFQVLEAGATGYLLRTAAPHEVIVAIREAHAGHRYVSPAVQARLDERSRWPVLTGRQRDVLALLAEGRTNAAIAAVLDIAPGTVKLHVKSILAKLDAEDRAEAAVVALRRGFARIS